jgi:hypothetical protein
MHRGMEEKLPAFWIVDTPSRILLTKVVGLGRP